ncbi:MAG: helix-turn-helix transcriptional regulator [Methanobrevibacter sp.]|jgi:DNA-binding XRE family transcriptional regulator|nr:helix-turn-helix transcriptional regulator [Methanobrevibacter sp.]
MRNHIKQLRKENNITLNDLSVMSDVPVEELGAIEDGTIEPTLLDAYNIKKALNQEFLADVFVFE